MMTITMTIMMKLGIQIQAHISKILRNLEGIEKKASKNIIRGVILTQAIFILISLKYQNIMTIRLVECRKEEVVEAVDVDKREISMITKIEENNIMIKEVMTLV